ncbi:MAG: hypothetical protein A2Z88_04740 [Omnitrophica WOR_2 bacterium GWA2_47_8]|nr:MAG: hypothetical protein A2Z88_04740 [Omnitrophica WOR_2 bacterium GWA2_47_8]
MNDPKLKVIIFDLDGTIVDAYWPIFKSFNHVMRELGLPLKEDSIVRRSVGWGEKVLFKPFVGERDLDKALKIYRRHHIRALKSGVKFLPGAKAVLEFLAKRNYILTVASNRPTYSTRIIARRLKMEKYFKYIICADKIKKFKPHPGLLQNILKKFSVSPSQALYVGDMALDVQTGRRAKVKTVAVLTGSSTRKEISRDKPFKIIRNVSHLSGIILKLEAEKS